jgi:uncharacterized repeat protein (TIGR03803 family)
MKVKIHSPRVAVWFWLSTILPLAQCATLQTPYSFSAAPTYPHAGLVQGSDGCLYGTSANGGTHGLNNGGLGAVFKVTTNGTLSIVFSFDNTHGANPQAGLIQGTDGNLYGTTQNGGTNGTQFAGFGTAFKVTTNGALTSLCSFTDGTVGGNPPGGFPVSGLVQGSDGNFYGTRSGGGAGTVFMVTSNGVFTTLASFANTNGAGPSGELVQGSDGNFYGTTVGGGDYGYGTVFRMTANGTLTTLASFTSTNGSNPYGALVQGNDGCFYGATFSGGAYSNIFEDAEYPPPSTFTVMGQSLG